MKKIEIWPLVAQDIDDRDAVGRERYGIPLTSDLGKDFLKEAYEEALDCAVYLRAALYERDGR